MLRPSLAIVMLLALVCGPRVLRGEFFLFKNSWGDVIVSTDTAEEGKALTPPTPERPVYYLGMSLGRTLGSIPGDQEPDKTILTHFVTRVLAKQGYLSARRSGHEPTLFLVVQWGYLTPHTGDLLWFLGYHPSQDIAAPSFPGFLGPEIWRRNFRSPEVETVLRDAEGSIYGIIVSAFDYKTAHTANPVILWQTRIGLAANGKSMEQALPTMLIAAGPSIGRPSDKPVLADADQAREGNVNLGQLKTLDVVDELSGSGETGGGKK